MIRERMAYKKAAYMTKGGDSIYICRLLKEKIYCFFE
jgi:hypothetical protein